MLTFQQILHTLAEFWEKKGCIIHQGHDLEVGAGTFNPATFLRCLGPEPYKTAYVEPSRRPSDGRFGENPNRLQLFHQYQVIIKPSPPDIIDLYKESLEAIGLDLKKHDLRFVHDDWESPTIGAHGLGWEVWIDGMEVTQFTYFQAVANVPLSPISVEITYGIERLCMYVQKKDNFFDMQWNENYLYGEIVKQNEIEWSSYNFSYASTEMWFRHFDDYEKEAKELIAQELVIPAYDFVIKASHAFNLLEARGAISVTERTGYIGRIRDLSRLIATQYLANREKLGYPLMEKLPKEELPTINLDALPTSFDPQRKESFLFEIGCEPLPATFVPIGIHNLAKSLETLLSDEGLLFDEIKLFGTPRRLGALITSLSEGTEEKKERRKGPAIASAFDASGQCTQQGAGFLKGAQITPPTLDEVKAGKIPELTIETIKGSDYLFATIIKKGRSIYEILAKALPKLILSLDFPKKMRWGSLDILFPRPIHWLTALYKDRPIPFALGDVASGAFTFGHDQLDPDKISIPNADAYFSLLKEHKVLVDVEERRKNIEDQLGAIEAELGAQALEKNKVLAQVLHLSEWPQLTHADFDESFLKVPPEVLISEMIEHQKYFPLADNSGKLINHFIITADNTPNDLIRHGNQKVLSARLSDGVFLYNQDLKVPLEKQNEKLKKMTFQQKLGSMLDKVERIQTLAQALNDTLKLADPKKVARATSLCKADLVTEMVGEFPELQGTIGKYLATAQNEDPEVATAIEEHWLPQSDKGPLPQTPTGTIVSLADKLDNLISYFKVGLKPTSSSDPYALRRQTIGLIKILLENQISIDLTQLLDNEVLLFLTSRAKGVFEEMGFAKDEVEASLSSLCKDPYDELSKVEALHEFRKTDSFAGLFEVYKRAKGQLEKQTPQSFDPLLAKEPAEKELTQALSALKAPWDNFLKQKSYTHAFEEMAKLQKPLAHLFDTVKILADDEALRKNRIALLQQVFGFFDQLLDFSKIQKR